MANEVKEVVPTPPVTTSKEAPTTPPPVAPAKVEAKVPTPEVKAKEGSTEKKDEVIENLNVLVIDDSKALRRVLVKYLQGKFYCTIFEADNGKDGLQVIAEKKGKVNLILCDLMMPVMDGLTFIKTIKANPALQNIPVIFLTAKNDKETVTKCIKLGASDFVVKPYDLAAISKKLSKFLTFKT